MEDILKVFQVFNELHMVNHEPLLSSLVFRLPHRATQEHRPKIGDRIMINLYHLRRLCLPSMSPVSDARFYPTTNLSHIQGNYCHDVSILFLCGNKSLSLYDDTSQISPIWKISVTKGLCFMIIKVLEGVGTIPARVNR